MKRTIIVLFAYLLALPASGQVSEIAKLQQAIAQHPQQDTTRVNLINNLAMSYTGQPDELEKLATEALSISRKTGYVLGEGYALLHLGNAKLRKGEKQEAVSLIQRADSIAKNLKDQELLGYVWLGKGRTYRGTDNQQALVCLKEGEAIALKTGNKKLAATSQREIASTYGLSFSNFPMAIEYGLKSVQSAEEADCLYCLSRSWFNLGALYAQVGDQNNSLMYYQKAADANKQIGDMFQEVQLNNNIGERYRLMGKYTEAIPYYNRVLSAAKDPLIIEMAESNLADVYTHTNSFDTAFRYAFASLTKAKQLEDNEGIAWIDGILSRLYLKRGMVDSAVFYSKQGLEMAKQTGTIEFMRDNAGALANAYAFNKDFENAYNYHRLYINYRDSMLNSEISNKSALLQYNYDLANKQAQITALDQQKKVQRNWLISILMVLLLIAITAAVLLRNNRLKQKANLLLEKQKLELEDQRDQTDRALAELQQAQKQLIQSEKMASLGELTAGIAHEIQNPLNFVNNFSETNVELLEELEQELGMGNTEQAKTIASDAKANEQKIIHHGRRAEAIVKSMLEHSRTSKGERQATDLNALCDEYLRLAYHGFRAKDKSFNATINTHFDSNIGKVNLVPQEIGRVLLNLFNNAFWAVSDKAKKQIGTGYEPRIEVRTKRLAEKIEIAVKDNGAGISQEIIDKVFQPFFTTKPTGHGTGLGLSLSYDIVKAHGGQLNVNTKEGEGTAFTISLPTNG